MKTLKEIAEGHPNLTFQNQGYQYIDKKTLSSEDLEAIEEIKTILNRTIEGFTEFFNFYTDKEGILKARLNYRWDASFTGVGYFSVSEIDKKREIMKTKTLNKIRETVLSLIICAMLLCFAYLFGTVLLGVARELITNEF